ncbi:MAG: ABC transporter permease, partial [Clostridiales bacterium]|nr:ABC transporter permease [Clostridiales bacterium]
VMKVTAVFDSGTIPSKYDKVKEGKADFLTEATFEQYISEGFHQLILVSEQFIEENKDRFDNASYIDYFDYCDTQFAVAGGRNVNSINETNGRYSNYNHVKVYDAADDEQAPITLFDSNKTTLADDELILNVRELRSLFDFGSGSYYPSEDGFEHSPTSIVLVNGKNVTKFDYDNIGDYKYNSYNRLKVYDPTDKSQYPTTLFDSNKTTLANDEIVLNVRDLRSMFDFSNSTNSGYQPAYGDDFEYSPVDILLVVGKDVTSFDSSENYGHRSYNQLRVYDPADNSQLPVTLFDSTKTTLASDEIILNLADIDNMFSFDQNDMTPEETSEYYDYYRALILLNNKQVYDYDIRDYRDATEEEIAEARATVTAYLSKQDLSISTLTDPTNENNFVFEGNYKVVGFYETNRWYSGIYCSKEFYDLDNLGMQVRKEFYFYETAMRILCDKSLYDYELSEYRAATQKEIDEARTTVLAFLKKQNFDVSALTDPTNDNRFTFEGNYKVVGFYEAEEWSGGIYCSQAFYNLDSLGMVKQRELYLYNTAMEILYNKEIYDSQTSNRRPATAAEINEARATVIAFLKKQDLGVSVLTDVNYSGDYRFEGNYKVVGFYEVDNGGWGIYCSQSFYDMADVTYSDHRTTKYVQEEDAIYHTAFIPFEKSESSLKAFFGTIGNDHIDPDTDVFFVLSNGLYTSVAMANDLVDTLSTVFLWVGIVLALFASLLLFNFISMSISNKKKEIGILRAVGARGLDVFKIFFAESGIIVGICTILSLVGTIVLTGVLNSILKSEIGLDVALFVFGGLSVALMIGVALVVAFISTFLPVYFAARKKPVESIRAL